MYPPFLSVRISVLSIKGHGKNTTGQGIIPVPINIQYTEWHSQGLLQDPCICSRKASFRIADMHYASKQLETSLHRCSAGGRVTN